VIKRAICHADADDDEDDDDDDWHRGALERAPLGLSTPAIAGVEKELASRGRPVSASLGLASDRAISRIYFISRRRRVPRTARNVLPTALSGSSIAYRFVGFVYAATLAIVSRRSRGSSLGLNILIRPTVGMTPRTEVARLTEAPMRIRCRQSIVSPLRLKRRGRG